MPVKQRAGKGTARSGPASPGTISPGSEESPRPRGKPRGRRRDRDCVTCKTRGLKCDLNRPQCLPCVQAGLSCGGYPLRVVWLEQRRPSATTKSRSTASRSTGCSSPVASLSTALSPTTLSSSATFSSSPTLSLSTACSSSSPPPPPVLSPALFPASPASSTVSSLVVEKPWCETDQNSLIKRLAALCNHILTTEMLVTAAAADEDSDAAAHATNSTNAVVEYANAHASAYAHSRATTNQYLSLPETTSLLSDLCVFIQTRLEGRNLATMAAHAHPHLNPPDSLEMVKHRLAALAHVNRAIAAANPFAFLGIATFAVFEVCDDTSFGEWQRHLYGARHLLDYHRCRTLADLHRLAALVPGLMDILARLVWFDVSGAVVHGAVDGGATQNSLEGDAEGNAERDIEEDSPEGRSTLATPGLIFDDWHRRVLLDDEFFSTVGVPADACALYVDVAKTRLAGRPVQACLRAAEQVLRVTTGPADDLSDWDLSANVNRCAAALAALGQAQQAAAKAKDADADEEKEMTGNDEEDEDNDDFAWESTTAAAVDKLCAALAATPASSRFYIHLAVGAYVAGMQARTREQCAVIRQYWRNCNVCGISRYPGGLARCEEHWRRVGLLGEGGHE